MIFLFFFFQAEDGIRGLVRSRGLGDVYKRQGLHRFLLCLRQGLLPTPSAGGSGQRGRGVQTLRGALPALRHENRLADDLRGVRRHTVYFMSARLRRMWYLSLIHISEPTRPY